MDLSKYTKVEHEDGRIEFIPIKKESEYLTVKEAAKLQKEDNPLAFPLAFTGGNMLIGDSGIQSVINLDVNLNDKSSLNDEYSEKPFKLFIGKDYNLEYVKTSPAGAKQYIFKKEK